MSKRSHEESNLNNNEICNLTKRSKEDKENIETRENIRVLRKLYHLPLNLGLENMDRGSQIIIIDNQNNLIHSTYDDIQSQDRVFNKDTFSLGSFVEGTYYQIKEFENNYDFDDMIFDAPQHLQEDVYGDPVFKKFIENNEGIQRQDRQKRNPHTNGQMKRRKI